jgi:carboxylate-amine ligase
MDTGYESYRTQWYSRWAITGPTEPLGDGATYQSVVEGLARAGAIGDSSNLYWDVRPSARHPTVEFRIGDVCTSVDDAVLHAALLRALTATLVRRARAEEPVPTVRAELLRAARWRAARFGLTSGIFDPRTAEVLDAREAVDRLLRELEPELAERGELEDVRELVDQLFGRGTSASRQRAVFQRTGDEHHVVDFIVREGLDGCLVHSPTIGSRSG